MVDTKSKRSWKDSKVSNRAVDWTSLIEVKKAKIEKDFVLGRLVGDYFPVARHWVKSLFLDKKTQKETVKSFPKWCLNFNPATEEFEDRGCPLCAIGLSGQRVNFAYWINRETQEDTQSAAKAFEYLEIGPQVIKQIKGIIVLNKHVDPETGLKAQMSLEDPAFGCDIHISYDDNNKPNSWSVQKGLHTPLTKDELKAASKLKDFADVFKVETVEEMKQDISRRTILDQEGNIIFKNGKRVDEIVSLMDDEDEPPVKKKRRADDDLEEPPPVKAKKKPAPVDNDDEDDLPPPVKVKKKPVPVDNDDEDDLPPPVKVKKKPVPVDNDDEDDDEDDLPPPVKVKKKPVPVDNEDDDEDDLPPPVKTKKKLAAAKEAEDEKDPATAAESPLRLFLRRFGITGTIKDENGREVPNCYGAYPAKMKCSRCSYVDDCRKASGVTDE